MHTLHRPIPNFNAQLANLMILVSKVQKQWSWWLHKIHQLHKKCCFITAFIQPQVYIPHLFIVPACHKQFSVWWQVTTINLSSCANEPNFWKCGTTWYSNIIRSLKLEVHEKRLNKSIIIDNSQTFTFIYLMICTVRNYICIMINLTTGEAIKWSLQINTQNHSSMLTLFLIEIIKTL